MKTILICLCLIVPLISYAKDDYDASYCKDPVELEKWDRMLQNNPDVDEYQALHALWIGLCLKVETHNLTTTRANVIFEGFRWGIIDMIKKQNEQLEKDQKVQM